VSGLTLLDVAIAMVFFFLLLSLVCSAANEILAALLQTRARFLERGIKRLLVTDDFANKLFDHALIRSLADEVDPVFKRLHKPLPSYIPSRTFALAMMDLLEREAAAVPATVQDALNALLNDVDSDANTIRQSIEDWYNNAMERVSGAYKRRVQYVLFALGIIAATALNADSIAVVERLTTNKTMSAAVVVAAAQQFINSGRPGDPAANAQQSLQSTLSTLDSLELPIGWNGPGPDGKKVTQFNNPAILWSLLTVHWIGWLVTGLAVSFGAPFWFDVLARIMNVRSTIKPPEKT
jgi:hypothetical protein